MFDGHGLMGKVDTETQRDRKRGRQMERLFHKYWD